MNERFKINKGFKKSKYNQSKRTFNLSVDRKVVDYKIVNRMPKTLINLKQRFTHYDLT